MKILPKLTLAFLLAYFFFACTETTEKKAEPLAENAKMVKSISYGIHVDTSKYTYAADRSDIFMFKNKVYSLRQRADYNKEGKIAKLVKYTEKGAVLYKEADLGKDPQVLKNSGMAEQQSPLLLERGSLQLAGKKMTIHDQTGDTYMTREKQPGMIRYTFFSTY